MTVSKLAFYYSPGACSLAPHIALEEAGAEYDPIRLDLPGGQQRSPEYLAINPKGRVPALADGSWALTENPAILRFIARRYPTAELWPDDPREEGRCAEWLAWIASTVHVAYAHVRRTERYASSPEAMQDVAAKGRATCRDLWHTIDERLSHVGPWAVGDRYTVADPYLLVFWNWGRGTVLAYDMPGDFPHWTAHARRMAERPAVRRIFEREGLVLPA